MRTGTSGKARRGGLGRAGRRALAAAALAIAPALGAPGCALGGGGPAPAAEDARVRSGEALFRRHCASCHGIRARGDGPMAALLTKPPADLTRIAARRDGVFPEPAILRTLDGRDPVVAHGTREMPVWGERFGEGLTGDAAETAPRAPALLLIEYLKTIQRPAEDAGAAASASEGGPVGLRTPDGAPAGR